MKQLYAPIVRIIYWLSWPITGLILHNSTRVRVYVVSEGKLLLQKTSYSSQKWSLPGGKIETDESEVAAAKRELTEETGVDLDENEFIKIGAKRIPSNGRSWPMMNVTFFMVELPKIPTTIVSRPLEIVGLGWFKQANPPKHVSDTVGIAKKMLAKTRKG